MKTKNDGFAEENRTSRHMRQPNVNVSVNAPHQKPAGYEWLLVGVFLGVIGWIIALVTDKGDGRGGKALGGCLLGPIIAIAFMFFLGVIGGA